MAIKVPMADLPAQYRALKGPLDEAVGEVLASGAFILGEAVADVERQIAAVCGAKHGIGVGNGTDALLLSLMALGIGPGDEVITPSFTFVATVETVALLGATPVFADIDPATFNLDPADVEAKLTDRTRAIVPVHLFGQLADMTEITRLARAHSVAVIGDSAQAIGSEHAGEKVAAWSDLSTLSFYPTKNLGAAGDGGMVLTSDDALAEKLRYLRFHGSNGAYEYRYVGVCSRLDALQAAILRVKLPHLANWNDARRANAAFYRDALGDVDGICLPHERPENVHTYHQFTLRVPHNRRDALKAFLAEKGVASGIFYPSALHLQPAYRNLNGKPGDFPETECACAEVLSIPVMPELTPEQRDHVAHSVRAFFAA